MECNSIKKKEGYKMKEITLNNTTYLEIEQPITYSQVAYVIDSQTTWGEPDYNSYFCLYVKYLVNRKENVCNIQISEKDYLKAFGINFDEWTEKLKKAEEEMYEAKDNFWVKKEAYENLKEKFDKIKENLDPQDFIDSEIGKYYINELVENLNCEFSQYSNKVQILFELYR